MFGFGPDTLFQIPGLLFALTFHEYAHARAAVSMGDPTPRYAGRLTLNPIPHLDPIGLIMLWLFQFGWAKPVPVNPFNLRDTRRGMLLVSLAGPGANIVLAFLSLLLIGLVAKANLATYEVYSILKWSYSYNLVLAVFNLIPMPPLDGSKIVSSLLPGRQAEAFERIAPYGPFILMGLVYVGVVGMVINPVMRGLDQVLHIVLSVIL